MANKHVPDPHRLLHSAITLGARTWKNFEAKAHGVVSEFMVSMAQTEVAMEVPLDDFKLVSRSLGNHRLQWS